MVAGRGAAQDVHIFTGLMAKLSQNARNHVLPLNMGFVPVDMGYISSYPATLVHHCQWPGAERIACHSGPEERVRFPALLMGSAEDLIKGCLGLIELYNDIA